MEGDVVALDVRNSTYVAINASGATLWPLLFQGTSHERLVDALVDAYSISPDTAAADVDAFLSELRKHDLLVPENA